jgi:hypothetical protein
MRATVIHGPEDVRLEEVPDPSVPSAKQTSSPNVGVAGGVASVRSDIPDVWSGAIEPGLVFDLTLPPDKVADAYVAMDERTAVKVMLRP